MKIAKSVIFIVLILLSISSIPPARGEIVTLQLTGTVSSIDLSSNFAFDGSVNVGTAMSATCIYDTDASPVSTFPIYDYPVISASMTLGNYTFAHNPLSVDPAIFRVAQGNYVYSIESLASRFDGTIYVNGLPKTYEEIG